MRRSHRRKLLDGQPADYLQADHGHQRHRGERQRAALQIFLQEVPEPKVVKNRIHFDLRVGGGLEVPVALRKQWVEAEVDRLIRAGATRLRTSDQEVADRYFVVMQDPEGNEVCLT